MICACEHNLKIPIRNTHNNVRDAQDKHAPMICPNQNRQVSHFPMTSHWTVTQHNH
jgi:hypothetical protein